MIAKCRVAQVAGTFLMASVALTACGDANGAVTPRESEAPDGPRVVIEVVRDGVETATFAEAVVRIENIAGSGVVEIDFGDHGAGGGWAAADVGCGADPGRSENHPVKHAYRRPGTWTVTATFTPGMCEGGHGEPLVGTAVVHVVEGATPSNGPVPPRLTNVVSRAAPGEPGVTALQAFPQDPDGYLTELRYAWGDGSADTVFNFPLSACVDPDDHWPITSLGDTPAERAMTFPQHRYERDGSYEVTVTAVTVGCDGESRQVARETATVTT